MWLRDSTAQVWPYLPLAQEDPALRRLLEGVVRRQTRLRPRRPLRQRLQRRADGQRVGEGPHGDEARAPRAEVGDRLALLPGAPRPRLLEGDRRRVGLRRRVARGDAAIVQDLPRAAAEGRPRPVLASSAHDERRLRHGAPRRLRQPDPAGRPHPLRLPPLRRRLRLPLPRAVEPLRGRLAPPARRDLGRRHEGPAFAVECRALADEVAAALAAPRPRPAPAAGHGAGPTRWTASATPSSWTTPTSRACSRSPTWAAARRTTRSTSARGGSSSPSDNPYFFRGKAAAGRRRAPRRAAT